MDFHNPQKQIATSNKRFRVVNCGRQFGKTLLSVYEMIGKATAKKDRQICYIATTYKQARKIAWQELKKITLPIQSKVNESRLEIEIRTQDGGTSKIMLEGWQNIEALRGMQFDLIVMDEVANYRNFWIGWQEVLLPTTTFRRGDVLFISTPKGFNHFYDLYNTTNKDFESFHFQSYDNPYLPKEEIDRAKEISTEDKFAQEYLAEFRKMEGLVYKEFDRDRHTYIAGEPEQFIQTISGIDWGYTNPAVVLQIKIDTDNNYWITDEWYKTGQTTEQIIQIAKVFNPQEVYPDPAEPDRLEELRKSGLNVREVSNDIPAGVNRVRELFKQNRIKINEKCKNLINELETYKYPEKKPETNEKEIPVKENDHACDALRYALYMQEPIIYNEQRKILCPPITSYS